ncbi:AzlC family ABC transporter permease [Alkalihalobacillus sp. AL-G]|uniref:AzlC family ABC transporter permease n=1 Tax=Alkalihalobacillus sp. AL-G TaxID=2926399 RepID=UPI00272CD6E9|nr:AzlC family ABC transporter permease [Alkalihalobacillus sp. AL-G]WLD94148.1 AzlC family ABC transporter permease [Alkalihalobacillus sp. AL-G]
MNLAVAERFPLPLFRQGFKTGLSIAIGFMPVAFTFGLLAKSSGLSLYETLSMSILVFAGASQYIALTLIAAGVGALELITTTFIVNIRHLLMSASISEKSADDPKWLKALYSFFITDETFSIAATGKDKIQAAYMFGLGSIAYGSWVVFSGVGYLIGAGLPQILQDSMGIALYALFIGLLVPSAKTSKKVILLAAIAAVVNCILTFATAMSTGWTIIISTLVSSILIEMIWKEETDRA